MEKVCACVGKAPPPRGPVSSAGGSTGARLPASQPAPPVRLPGLTCVARRGVHWERCGAVCPLLPAAQGGVQAVEDQAAQQQHRPGVHNHLQRIPCGDEPQRRGEQGQVRGRRCACGGVRSRKGRGTRCSGRSDGAPLRTSCCRLPPLAERLCASRAAYLQVCGAGNHQRDGQEPPHRHRRPAQLQGAALGPCPALPQAAADCDDPRPAATARPASTSCACRAAPGAAIAELRLCILPALHPRCWF